MYGDRERMKALGLRVSERRVYCTKETKESTWFDSFSGECTYCTKEQAKNNIVI